MRAVLNIGLLCEGKHTWLILTSPTAFKMGQNGSSGEGKNRHFDERQASLKQCFVLSRVCSKTLKNQQNFLY